MENKYIILIGLIFVLLGILVFILHKRPTPTLTLIDTQAEVAKIRYMALGDSYTIGQSVTAGERFPNQLVAALKDKEYSIELLENPSRTGYTTEDLLQFEIPVLAGSDANLISILIGVNDQFRGVSATDFERRYREVIEKVTKMKPEAKIFIVTIPDYSLTPQGITYGNQKEVSQALQEFNSIIQTIAQEKNIPVVDIWEISQKVSRETDLLANDGLHPSGKQYTKWTEKMLPAVELLLQK